MSDKTKTKGRRNFIKHSFAGLTGSALSAMNVCRSARQTWISPH